MTSRPTVCLSFDFDAIAPWIGTMGLDTPQYVARGEFAANVATPRILDMLAREDIRATFFIPGLDAETFPDVCKRIRDAGHEIGHHNYAHETPTDLAEPQEREIIERGLEALDKVVGVRPAGYRSPACDLSPNTTRLLVEYGFSYDSSCSAMDFDFYKARTGDVVHADRPVEFGQELDLVEVPISWQLDDFVYMEFAMKPPMVLPASADFDSVCKRWIDDLDFMVKHVPDGVFTMVNHPQAIGRSARLNLLERLIQRAQHHNAEFVTISDAIDGWEKRQGVTATS